MRPTITNHAVLRYQERVARVSADEARAVMLACRIAQAAEFGCHTIKLGCGARLILEGAKVVTVIGAEDRYYGRAFADHIARS